MPGIAEKYAEKATTADPLHARAWCLRGQAVIGQGSREGGMKLIRLAREMDPESREIWYVLEHLEQKERERKEAEAAAGG